ncbi:MAG: hypothetical protein ACHQ49_00455 [Elusimicrobiota bacterium]
MKRLPVLLFLVLCAAAVARGEDDPDFPQTQNGARHAGADSAGADDDAGDRSGDRRDGGEERAGEMSLDDARVNFTTIVQAYVAKNSPDGYWPYVEKKAGKAAKTWRLARPSVADDSVEKGESGIYSGRVTLRDARVARKFAFVFSVDFSGDNWKVVKVKPAPPPASAPAPAKAAAADQ